MNTHKELMSRLKSGSITWEESGLLEKLSDMQKVEIKKLFDIGINIVSNETDIEIQQVLLPCIRRIYSGLYDWYVTSQTYISMVGQKNVDGLPFVFSNPETIHNMLLTKYRILKKGMDVLTTTDTQAETTALLCEDYIRSVKELVRKDIESVKKIINREIVLDELLK